jgi:hypothetical protein
MPKFHVEAMRTIFYSLKIEAEDIDDAQAQIDEWDSDDFELYAHTGSWEIEINEVEE